MAKHKCKETGGGKAVSTTYNKTGQKTGSRIIHYCKICGLPVRVEDIKGV